MESSIQVPASRGRLWTGRILSTLAILFMLFDASIHMMRPAAVVDAFAKLGLPLSIAVPVSIIEFVCVALYAIPRTSVLGAILLTGYLGGAVAIQARIGAPLLSTTLFPIYVALFIWGGLYLRDERVRGLVPIRR